MVIGDTARGKGNTNREQTGPIVLILLFHCVESQIYAQATTLTTQLIKLLLASQKHFTLNGASRNGKSLWKRKSVGHVMRQLY
jgi:hypothetical protein